jgi:proline iminopeptidase
MIVILHSGPGGDYRDLLNCKDLADYGYRVVFYDQRGSGLSQRFPKKSYTRLGRGALDMIYDDLTGVIAHYRTSPTQKVFLTGQSWGAILATGYAARHPDAVQGLVVCEPGGFAWDDIEEYFKKSRSFSLWGESLNDVAYLDQFMSGKEDQHEILDYKVAMAGSKNEITGEDNTEPGSYWRFGAVVSAALLEIGKEHKPDFSDGIRHFNKPVLFFYSEKNEAYPVSWAQKLSGAFGSADLFKVTGVGHQDVVRNKTTWTQQTLPRMLDYFNAVKQ